MLLLGLILLPAAAGLLATFLRSVRSRVAVLVGVASLHVVGTAWLWWAHDVSALGGWLAVDALGRIVLSVVSLVFLAVAVYAIGFLAAQQAKGRRLFIRCLLAFLSAASLVSLAHHLALVWIGMEATTLALAPLVFFKRDRRSLEAAWKYLVLSSVGIALALLGTFFLAAAQVDGRPLILEDLILGAATLRPGLLHAAFVFLLVGYGTKMGLAPLHSWKPDTYGEAPSLVAGLMAGALTSCAFLGLARTTEVMAAAHQTAFIQPPLLALGLASLIISAGFMIGQADLKRLLAYSSVEHMGLLAIALGIGGAGTYGAALHLLNNGLIKTVMFLAVGNVVMLSGTSEASATRGLLRRAPITGALLVAGLFAVTGSPPFGLFVSEFTILGAAFHEGLVWLAVVVLALLAVIFVGMARMILGVAYGRADADAPRLVETFPLVAGSVLLGGLVLMLGLYIPSPLHDSLAEAARALGGGAP
ncbi:MAG TPA: proton-conducting transporter membrane subunit [Candidatus Saccharimonadaceae bacterium]|jgi:hydrogenase-4 component F|nr:proton-conducting transporter membrane subunit [Candidatus Saccharimonadaceae bacterium]